MADIKVLALLGSLRAASINRKIAELAAAVAPDGVTVNVFEGLGELPFYNEEIDPAVSDDVQDAPAAVAALSMGNEVPASAAAPSGDSFRRRRASASRPRSRLSIST